MLMFAQREASSERAYRAIRTAVAAGSIPRSLVEGAASRVDSLKHVLAIG
jgi:hypothetical protein